MSSDGLAFDLVLICSSGKHLRSASACTQMCRDRLCFGLYNVNLYLASLALLNPLSLHACLQRRRPEHQIFNRPCPLSARRNLLTNDSFSGSRLVSVSKAVYSWHYNLCRNPHAGSLLNVNHTGLEAEAVGDLLIC